jgi:sorbitol-specific phosphotransferase system component IIA
MQPARCASRLKVLRVHALALYMEVGHMTMAFNCTTWVFPGEAEISRVLPAHPCTDTVLPRHPCHDDCDVQ